MANKHMESYEAFPGNANGNHRDIPRQIPQNASKKIQNSSKMVRRSRENPIIHPSGDVKWYSHCGKQWWFTNTNNKKLSNDHTIQKLNPSQIKIDHVVND